MSFLARLFPRRRAHIAGSPAFNDQLRDVLEQKFGDDGVEPRPVAHYAYPRPGADLASRSDLLSALRDKGFDVKDAANNNGVVLEHNSQIAPDIFDVVTAELSAWFAARRWDYDGWQCAINGNEPHCENKS